MKRLYSYLIAALAVSIIACWSTTPAHAQLGIAGGANFDNIGDIRSGEDEGRFDNATGFHVGIFYDLAVGPVAVRPGLFYADVGTFDFSGVEGIEDNVDIDMLELPIDVRLRLATLPIIRPYATAGPVFQLARQRGDGFDNLNMAANIGLGAELSFPGFPLTLMPELRYAFGISRFTDGFDFGDTVTVETGGERLNTFMLRLGVKF